MAGSFVFSNGFFLEVTAPKDITEGEAFYQGALFCVAKEPKAEGQAAWCQTGGLSELPKGSVELATGAKAFFDVTTQKLVQAESAQAKAVGIVVKDASEEDEKATVLLVQKI